MTTEDNFIFTIEKEEGSTFACSTLPDSKGSLHVDLWCLCEGTEIPLIDSGTKEKLLDSEGNQKTFKATSELLKNSILTSHNILFDQDHDLETHIGDVDLLYLDESFSKLGAKGIITNPLWVKRITENDYSGISVYGRFTELNESPSLAISRISFLRNNPGACNKQKCYVKESVAAAEGWDGDKAKQSLFEKFSDDEGNLQKNKLKKYFLIVEESGENKGDYKYPIGEVIDGTAKITKEGCWTAFNFANRENEKKRHPGLVNKLIKIMKRESIELPPSVKADNQSNKILKGENMTLELNDEIKTFLKETITETVKTSLEDVQTSVMDSMSEQFEQFKAGFAANAPVGAPEGPDEETQVIEPLNFWELAKENIGLTEEEFTKLQEDAGKVPDLAGKLTEYETRLTTLDSELSDAKAFITEVEKKDLQNKLPPALRDGVDTLKEVIDGKEVETEVPKIDILYKEMKADPSKFYSKYGVEMAKYEVNKTHPGFAAGSANSDPKLEEYRSQLSQLIS